MVDISSPVVFHHDIETVFLPTKKKTQFTYMFSCPFFNLDNVYSGSISLYWYDIFESSTETVFLPTKKKTQFTYMFSCPFFNLDNVYAGSISLYWYDIKPDLGFPRLSSMCGQAGQDIRSNTLEIGGIHH
ncbi:holin [Escherichia phage vB_EcoM_005]|uniref:T-like holin lysis mediator n=1 Tax=Escherichia phage vB_EcoM_005 TaxID=2500761 RepID=A0A3T0IM95_9CAUD|nr:holin [Escherichia phage vB_EcoM_005]AZV01130.1 T-like holin lysis mediator [Escherichia phage vB_EcoM_005]